MWVIVAGDKCRSKAIVSNTASQKVTNDHSCIWGIQNKVFQLREDSIKSPGHLPTIDNMAIKVGEKNRYQLPVGCFLLKGQSDDDTNNLVCVCVWVCVFVCVCVCV